MDKIYTPSSLKELKELVNDKNVRLGDIDTSLITDMTELFKDSKIGRASCRERVCLYV